MSFRFRSLPRALLSLLPFLSSTACDQGGPGDSPAGPPHVELARRASSSDLESIRYTVEIHVPKSQIVRVGPGSYRALLPEQYANLKVDRRTVPQWIDRSSGRHYEMRPSMARCDENFTFSYQGRHVVFRCRDELAAAGFTFEVCVSPGEQLPSGWTVQLGSRRSEGFLLVPGTPLVLRAPAPQEPVLRFGFNAMVSEVAGTVTDETPVELVVRRDGAEGREEFTIGELRDTVWRSTSVGGRRSAELVTWSFTVNGPPGVYGVHLPMLERTPSPSPVGGKAPPNRDVVLFVADTLRADVLGCYGAKVDLTPVLDAIAAVSWRFEQCWSAANWTLPSQASILFGLYPHQHGATTFTRRPAPGLVSLAAHLQEAGYRTVAITDGLFVSPRHGLDAGFETFLVRSDWSIERTIDEAIAALRHEDHRPLFLFVQTYKVHSPYDSREETRQRLEPLLGPSVPWLEVQRRVGSALLRDIARERRAQGLESDDTPADILGMVQDPRERGRIERLAREEGVLEEGQSLAELLRALYFSSLSELDTEVARLWKELASSGRSERTLFAFTSDHGELIDDHDRWFHALSLWEEVLHVPLLLHVPGAAPDVVARRVSNVGLARTLCELAGVEPLSSWEGGWSEPGPALVLAEDCDPRRTAPRAALFDDPWKVVVRGAVPGPADLTARYLLAEDPREADNRKGAPGFDLPMQLARYSSFLESARRTHGAAEEIELDDEQAEMLRAMGYLYTPSGDADDEDDGNTDGSDGNADGNADANGGAKR